jgi:hypothetical protein
VTERLTEPGTVEVHRRGDGTRVVVHADPLIQVAVGLLTDEVFRSDVMEPDGVLRLDTAGEYRYRYVRAESEQVHLYERIMP